MNKLVLPCLLFAFLIVTACSAENYERTNKEDYRFSGIQIQGDFPISLPENAINLESIQIIDSEDGYFLIGNSAINGLQFLDKQGKVLKQILVSDIRNADFQNNLQYVIYHNSDSIFILNNINGLLINDKGELIQQFNYHKKSSLPSNRGIHMASGFKPYFHKGHLYLNSQLIGHDKGQGFIFKFSLHTQTLELLFNYPENYNKGYWVGSGYHRLFSLFLPETESFLVGFPWDKQLYLYNLNDGSSQIINGSPAHIPQIKAPFQSFEDRQGHKYNELERRAYSQFEFSSLILDPFRDLIYRIMEYPLTEEEVSNLGSTPFYLARNFQILVFERKTFELVGKSEILPKGSHVKTRYFVNEEGLFLEQVQQHSDEIRFTKFLFN